MRKGLMEKLMTAKTRNKGSSSTIFCATRYGNVMASRGSVIPLFVNLIQANKPLTITDPSMTRFLMTLDESVELVMHAFEKGGNGDIFGIPLLRVPRGRFENLRGSRLLAAPPRFEVPPAPPAAAHRQGSRASLRPRA